MFEAAEKCPAEAAELAKLTAAVLALPSDAPLDVFTAAYDRVLDARDRLYDAWLAQEADA